MPTPTAPLLRKSARSQKKRVISDPSEEPKVSTKRSKPKHLQEKSVTVVDGIVNPPTSDNSVVLEGSSNSDSIMKVTRYVYNGYSRKYLYDKWM